VATVKAVKHQHIEEEPCHFLKLPAELRNKINHLALVHKEVLYMDDTKPSALLRTCRQIRSEALSIFYSNNAFRAFGDEPQLWDKWLERLGDEKCNMLKRICLEAPFDVRGEGQSGYSEATPAKAHEDRQKVLRLIKRGRFAVRKAAVFVYMEVDDPDIGTVDDDGRPEPWKWTKSSLVDAAKYPNGWDVDFWASSWSDGGKVVELEDEESEDDGESGEIGEEVDEEE
jgi:hypothetical protein